MLMIYLKENAIFFFKVIEEVADAACTVVTLEHKQGDTNKKNNQQIEIRFSLDKQKEVVV